MSLGDGRKVGKAETKKDAPMQACSIYSVMCLLAVAVHGKMLLSLSGFEGGDSSWSGAEPVTSPVHAGRCAMKWDLAAKPTLDGPRSWADWSRFDEIRFWAYSERNWDRNIPIVFVSEGGYYIIRWRVDWTGWKEQRIRLDECAPAHSPVGWRKISHIGFRALGYGQPPVPVGMTLVFDEFQLHSPRDIPYRNVAEWRRKEMKKHVQELKAEGNPYFLSVLKGLEGCKRDPTFKKRLDSCWAYSGEANRLLITAWAAASDDSPRKGDSVLISNAVATVDWLLSEQDGGTWFYSRKWKAGDANTDRFILGPLADAVWWLRSLPEMEEKWRRWEKPLKECVDFQHVHWCTYNKRGLTDGKGWGSSATIYPNQDVFILHIMELAHRWWGESGYRQSVDDTLAGLRRQLLPDGAFHYIGPETECHTYHNLNLVWIARYLHLTNDLRARSLIVDSVEYYPSAMSNEAVPEYYTDCWWKHYWGDGAAAGPEIVAGVTGDARNKWLANRLIERVGPGNGYATVYAGMFYRDGVKEAPLPDNYIRFDRNIGGPRGRFGNFYFAGTVGGGARDTFAGCMLSDPDRPDPLYGALLAVNIEADQGGPGKRFKRCGYISGPNDITAVRVDGDVAALGVRYTLHKPYINSRFNPQVPPMPWSATQVWFFTRHGLVGLVEVEALEPKTVEAIRGELRFGPKAPLRRVSKATYVCGGLTCRVLDHNFATVRVNPARGVYVAAPKGGSALNLRTGGNVLQATPGKPFMFAASVGPTEAPAPEDFVRLVEGGRRGLRVTFGGVIYTVTFDPGARTIEIDRRR